MDDLFSNYDDFTEIRKEHAINSMSCYLITPQGKVPVNVILDSGSNTSNIDETLIEKFKLKQSTPEFLRTVRYVSTNVSYPSAGYDLQLMSKDGDYTQAVRAYRVRNFGSKVPDWIEVCSKHDYLKSLPVLKTQDAVSRILLGTDCKELFHTLESRMSDNDGPTAIRNVLGWSFLGRFTSNNLAPNVPKSFKNTDVTKPEKIAKKKSYDSELNDIIKRSFEIEDWNLQ